MPFRFAIFLGCSCFVKWTHEVRICHLRFGLQFNLLLNREVNVLFPGSYNGTLPYPIQQEKLVWLFAAD